MTLLDLTLAALKSRKPCTSAAETPAIPGPSVSGTVTPKPASMLLSWLSP